jgi:hypothetical protein
MTEPTHRPEIWRSDGDCDDHVFAWKAREKQRKGRVRGLMMAQAQYEASMSLSGRGSLQMRMAARRSKAEPQHSLARAAFFILGLGTRRY